MINQIHNEDAILTMNRMPDEFLDLVVTSPPYDGLRKYNGYVFDFENIAKELYRVIKSGGVIVWIVADETIDGDKTGTSFRQALFFKEIGFRLHDVMIYEKNGAAYPANSKSKRYSQVFEYMFILSKGEPKTVNLIKDRKNRWAGSKTFGESSNRQKNGEIGAKKGRIIGEFSYRDNIWRVNNGYGYTTTDEFAYEHPAMFPESLAGDHIISWSKDNDLVYDPFGGSGTVGKMCQLLHRRWIMSEISPKYCEIAKKRINEHKGLF